MALKLLIIGWYHLIYPITSAKKQFEILGFDVYFLPLLYYNQKFSGESLYNSINSFIANIGPLVILWWNWECDENVLKKIKENTPGILHCLFNWDHPFCLTNWDNTFNRKITSKNIWDICFVTADCKLDEYIKSGSKEAYYLRMFADQNIHCPKINRHYNCDVAFVCTNLYEDKDMFPNQLFDRKTLINDIINSGINIKIYGPDSLKQYFPDHYCGFSHFLDNNNVFYNSKINLCTHVTNGNKYCNERVGTILSSGGLLLCDKVDGIENILTNGKDCIFLDEKNYVNQIKDILENYEKYTHIKENAVKTARNKFSAEFWASYITSKIMPHIKDTTTHYTFENPQPKKVSIVMTYYNRINQFINTLDTIEETKYPKHLIELICYDDRSDKEPCIIDLSKYTYKIKLIYGEYERDKSIINSTYSYNNAFKYINGEYVIIQNSECMHIGDIITYIVNNASDNNIISLPCWATANEEITDMVFKNRHNFEDLKNIVDREWDKLLDYPREFKGWYNEKYLRPQCLHFCNAMHIDVFKKVGLFDTKLCKCLGFDDNDYAERIMFNLNIDIIIPEHEYKLFVVHQYHGKYNKPREYSLFLNSLNEYNKINNYRINKKRVGNNNSYKIINKNYSEIIANKDDFIKNIKDDWSTHSVYLTIDVNNKEIDNQFLIECLDNSNFRLKNL